MSIVIMGVSEPLGNGIHLLSAECWMLTALLGSRAGAGMWLLCTLGCYADAGSPSDAASGPAVVIRRWGSWGSEQCFKLQCLFRPWQPFQGLCSLIFNTAL